MAILIHGPSWTAQGVFDFLGGQLQNCRSSEGVPVFQPRELKKHLAFRRLQQGLCSEAIKPESPETAQILLEIWNTAFPAEPRVSAQDGEHWKRLGFQSHSPSSDLRSGHIALHQLHYLATAHPELLRRLAFEAHEAGYPLACSCLNVTQLIIVFFGLHRQPTMSPVPGAATASPAQFRNFAKLCARCDDGAEAVLDELFCALVERLHDIWRLLQATEGLSLMDFDQALRKVHSANARFWSRPRVALAELRALAIPSYEEEEPEAEEVPHCKTDAGLGAPPGLGVSALLQNLPAWMQAAVGNQLGEHGTSGAAETRSRNASSRRSHSCCTHGQHQATESDRPLFGGRG